MAGNNNEISTYRALLVERDRGFAFFPGLQPFGSVEFTVEGEKGKLNCHVRNLHPAIDGRGAAGEYHLWLVANEGEKPIAVHLGKVEVDHEGQGGSQLEINILDVGDSGRKLLEFDQVVITFNLEEIKFHLADKIPLLGNLFIKNPQPWLDQMPINHMAGCYPPPWLGSGPFGSTLMDHNWMSYALPPWLVPQPAWWPDRGTVSVNHPIMNKYPRQIIGVKLKEGGSVQYMVHGLLGRYCCEDWPHQGRTGYRHWHPLPGSKYQGSSWGYWLLYIDPVTGQRANPLEDTIPPE